MNTDEITNKLKEQYPREIRKQLVKSILHTEKTKDKVAIEKQYQLLNQIFSYILHECNWDMAKSSDTWDNTPLKIMTDVFPQLITSQWYQEQNIVTSKNIEVKTKEQ